MMDSFHFLRPLWLLALIPTVLLGAGLLRRQRGQSQAQLLIAPHLLTHLIKEPEQQSRFRPLHLLVLFWVAAALALSGPTWRKQPNPFAQDESGLYVLMEFSGTMLANDVPPNRLERAKQKLSDLLELRAGAPTGLIVYSGSAHLVMPLTTDGRILMQMIEDLEPESMPKEGHALSEALALADRMFVKAGQSGSVLAILDGVDESELPNNYPYPIQFLPMAASVPTELTKAARLLDAKITPLTVDEADAERISRQTSRDMKSILSSEQGDRWSDAGYYLIPLLVLATLLPFRKGWVVE
ncbi:vWA domain-containing protein [Pontiella sulfatireligans]|uniref:VWFA domain-containing protein n=1 Tax=Pontiella sulfatireligans TaxID=2750658 RepID=A0A6C2UE69_9BACT|nr:VWA domain-containing protein [Pontiella sulfatireligans]VGO18418.1 hypothetical protein SCARR_00471 [Pontiella sulfatireligans]